MPEPHSSAKPPMIAKIPEKSWQYVLTWFTDVDSICVWD
jgi:hypothetical protein